METLLLVSLRRILYEKRLLTIGLTKKVEACKSIILEVVTTDKESPVLRAIDVSVLDNPDYIWSSVHIL